MSFETLAVLASSGKIRYFKLIYSHRGLQIMLAEIFTNFGGISLKSVAFVLSMSFGAPVNLREVSWFERKRCWVQSIYVLKELFLFFVH